MSVLGKRAISELTYVDQVYAFIENLPDNSLAKAALLAIQNNAELPKYYSQQMQAKAVALQNCYHKPDISEEERLAIQRLFQNKMAKIEPLSESSSHFEDPIPECLRSFSVTERSIIFEFARFCNKDFSLDKDLKDLEDVVDYVERLSLQEIQALLRLIQSTSFSSGPSNANEETQKLIKLVKGMIPQGLSPSEINRLILDLFAATINRSFGESEVLLNHIRGMITEGSPAKDVFDISMTLSMATVHKSFEDSLAILKGIKGLTFPIAPLEVRNFPIINLGIAFRGKSFEESEELLKLIRDMIPKELSDHEKCNIVGCLASTVDKSFEDSKEILKLIRDMIPDELVVNKTYNIILNLADATANKSFAESKKLLELVKSVIPRQGLDSFKIGCITEVLAQIISKKTFEQSREILLLIKGMSSQKNLTSKETYEILLRLVHVTEEKTFEQAKGLLLLIKEVISLEDLTLEEAYDMIAWLTESIWETTFEESKKLLRLIKGMMPLEDLNLKETHEFIKQVTAAIWGKSFEQSKEVLEDIKEMIPEGASLSEAYDITLWLTMVICQVGFEPFKEFLKLIRSLIPEGVSSNERYNLILVLIQVVFDQFNKIDQYKLFEFMHDQCRIEGLSGKAKCHSIYSLARVLRTRSEEETKALLNHIKLFTPYPLIQWGIVNVLAKLGPSKSEEVLEIITMPKYVEHWEFLSLNVLPFIENTMSREAVIAFLDEFTPPKINTKDEAEHLSQVIEPFIRNLKTPAEIQQLCEIFKSLPEGLRFRYSNLAKQFSFNLRDVVDLVKCMQKIKTQASTRKEFCDSLKQYLEGPTSSLDKYSLALDALRWEGLKDAALISSLKWTILRHEYTTSLEELMESLPLNDFTYSALSEILSGRELLKQGPDSIFKKLVRIQEKQDLSNDHQAAEKGKKALNEIFRQRIEAKINPWKDLSLEEKVEVMLIPFGINNSSLPREWHRLSNDDKYYVLLTAQLLQIKSAEALARILLFSREELDDIVLSIFSLLSDYMTDNERTYIAHECIKDISPLNLRAWMALIKNRPPWETIRDLLLCKIDYAGLAPYFLPLVKSDMSMTVMEKILEELREEPLEPEILRPFMKKGMNVDTVKALFSAFKKVPTDLRLALSQLIATLLERNPATLDVCSLTELCILAGIPPDTAKATFEAAVLSKIDVLPVACKIFDCQKALKLQDDSSLVKSAMFTILAGPKDTPYYTHAVIKQKRQEYPACRISMPVTQIPSQSKYRAQIQLTLSGLQNGLQIIQKQEKTYGEFEAWIKERNKVHQDRNPGTVLLGPSVFKDLLNRIEKHLINQNLQEQLKEIWEITENVTSKELLTEKLMSQPMEDESVKVPETIIRLYAIADAILSESSGPGSLFSPQEEAVMTWLRLIQHCSVGQEAGISVCYHDLQAGGKIPRLQASSKYETEVAEQEMATALQKAMNDVIQSPQILRRLGVEEYIGKGVHQALFLKNLIGQECGLNHEETMETIPKEISGKLLAYDRKYILEVFFYELSLHLVDSLKSTFNGLSPELKNKRYSLNQRFFSFHHVDLTKAWVLEENPPKVCFPSEVQGKSINRKIAEQCILKFPEQKEFWFLEGKRAHMTEKGRECFEAFLEKEGEDISLLEEDKGLVRLLQFAEDYHIQSYRGQFYHSNTGKLTEEGEILLRKELMDSNSHLYKIMKRMELSIEHVTSNIKDHPLILTSFLQTSIPKREAPWSLQDQPASYELTEFGALALLEKGGYLQVQGTYGRYLNLMVQLGEISEKLSFIEPLTIENVQKEVLDREKRVKRLERIPLARLTSDEKAEKELSHARLESLKEYARVYFEVSVLERDFVLELPSENVPPEKPAFQEMLL